MTTIAEDRDLIERTRAALVVYLDHPTPLPSDGAGWTETRDYTERRRAQETTARRLVNDCLTHGITVGRIIATTPIPVSAVIPLVSDDQHRADTLAAEAHRLELATSAVRRLRAADAVRLHADGTGMRKIDLAPFLSVTRVTLDKWLSGSDR